MPNKTYFRPFFFISLLSSLLVLSACSQFIQQESMTQLPTPTTSPKDDREYRSLALDNGLKVLLIQDPEAEKAAASMNIAAGSLHEPDAWPGLAHYLEHMLFLGTETFPEPDSYQNFIRQQGGSYNAFTAPRDTNYFFDIRPDHLDGALARFSRFFVNPLLNPEYLKREVNAVNSEWSATLQDDGRRRQDALRLALNPEHPASRFSAGNRETLDTEDPQLREALLQYHQDFYHPDRMTLVIFGPQSLDKLEALTQEHFIDLEQQESRADPDWPQLLLSEQLPAQLDILPLRQKRELQLLFQVPDATKDFRKKPDNYLAHLIGHEGQGSLLNALKNKGWVTGLSAGTQMRTGQQALFSINLELTPEGDQKTQEIQAAVFAWLDLIRAQGIEKWRFDEKVRIAENSFRFMESSDPSNLVTHLAMQMPRYPIEELLRAPYAWDEFDAELIQHYLEQLQPEKRLLVHISPEVETNQTTRWVPADYRLQQPLPEDAQPLPPAPEDLAIQLPEPNPFLPSSLALLDGENQQKPELIKEQPGMEVWQGLDTSFEVPRSQIYISLQNPEVVTDLRQRVLAQLTARWLEDQLNAPGYPARLAGLNYQAYAHSRGITLALGGFSAEQPRLAKMMLDQLLKAEVEESQFQRIQQRLEQNLMNQNRDRLPRQMIRQLFTTALHPSWTPEQQLKALQAINHEDLMAFIPSFTSQLYIQLLAWGNSSSGSIESLSEDLHKRLQPELAREDVDLLQVRQIPAGQWSEKLDIEHNDRGLLFYIQGQNSSPAEEARLRLLSQLQASAFFHELRTQQQLGYAVFSNYLPLIQQPGLFYFIQSPDTEPDELAEATEAFLRSDLQRIERMSSSDFAQHQQSVVSKLRENDKRLSQRAEGFWQEIGYKRYDFDHKEEIATEVENLSQQEMMDFYLETMNFERGFYLLGTSPKKKGRLLPGQNAQPQEWPLD
ncbi:insulinase family protein [Marinospirillum sp.]|uniref:insulinase family protein n=1 Tax=Marinospirillum sp. TaxID=2183934 RepID=UPI0028702142|nr:insulinase family protein [Marinospirillum sp.]MDR9469001.1 insulinase family protein [Marinospirillum sp.]